MEGNSTIAGGGMMAGMASGILGLEMPLHQQQQQQHLQQQQQQQQQHQQHHLISFSAHQDTQTQQSSKQQNPNYSYPSTKPKQQQQQQQVPLSEEDEPGLTGEDGAGGEGKKRISPWQRMKWTDSMVRLLIMVVFYIGDDCAGTESNDHPVGGGSKKKTGGVLQKKGKWKSVSRAMMEKGFYVSPQQCEDKFNDLNKRYKRVNDILGKGTACRVVENQSLLETMDHLSPKMKEEVRKLLNSKHLFFREMCAYHNSGGGGGGGGGSGGHQCSEAAVAAAEQPHHQLHHHQQQQRCFHSSESTAVGASSRNRAEPEGMKMGREAGEIADGEEEGEEDDDDDDEEEDEDEDDEEADEENDENEGEEESAEGIERRHNINQHQDDVEDEKLGLSNKRKRTMSSSMSPAMRQLRCELMGVLQDGGKSPWEQKQWVMNQLMQLEEQQLSYHCRAFELEKQRLKWLKFCNKKEREMERMKLKNEQMKLENERMILLFRQKELELMDLHRHYHHQLQQQQQHSASKRPDPSSIIG